MKCSKCNASNAQHRWDVKLCADGKKWRSRWLCDACDKLLNELVLDFFNIPGAREKADAYKARP